MEEYCANHQADQADAGVVRAAEAGLADNVVELMAAVAEAESRESPVESFVASGKLEHLVGLNKTAAVAVVGVLEWPEPQFAVGRALRGLLEVAVGCFVGEL